MQLWIAIVLIGLAGLGAGLWLLRTRRQGAAPPQAYKVPGPVPARDPIDRGPAARYQQGQVRAPIQVNRELVDSVPNVSIPQLPENRPLAVLEFDGPPGRVPVQHGEMLIGRHSDDDVRVPDIRVSRHHARLVASGDGIEIHNLTAARSEPNPMLVNGKSRERASVADGDVITLGGVSFRLRLASG